MHDAQRRSQTWGPAGLMWVLLQENPTSGTPRSGFCFPRKSAPTPPIGMTSSLIPFVFMGRDFLFLYCYALGLQEKEEMNVLFIPRLIGNYEFLGSDFLLAI